MGWPAEEKLGHAAASITDLSGRSDLHYRGPGVPTRGWEGGVLPRADAGVSAWREGSEKLPDVHQSVDRQWDGETARYCAGIRSAAGDGETIHEGASRTRDSGFFPTPGGAMG